MSGPIRKPLPRPKSSIHRLTGSIKGRRRLLTAICWATLSGLVLFVWSVVDPRPIPVMIAMSVGQVIGTLATLGFVYIVLADLRGSKVLPSRRHVPKRRPPVNRETEGSE